MKRRTGLSKTQSIRYGGLVAVMCGRTPYPFLLEKLREGEFVLVEDRSNSSDVVLTQKGHNEFERLTKLAGLPSWQEIERI
tara:strand:- start:221 stop:463 length:243 start_codon:yes stop_codon:yes gene_type:complete